jgi:hypothetical protein
MFQSDQGGELSSKLVIVVTKGSDVAFGAREIACTWAGIAWTTLLLIIKLSDCLGLAGSSCNTLYVHPVHRHRYDSGVQTKAR